MSDDCLKLLKDYSWPGNVRQLENVITGIVALKGEDRSEILPADLPAELSAPKTTAQIPPAKTKIILPGNTKLTDEKILSCMEKNGNNQSQTARDLKVSIKTVQRRWAKIKSSTEE